MDDDVTRWVHDLAQGDEGAAQRIWERYFDRMVRLARKKLGQDRGRAVDEEDVALSALKSFCRAATEGRFPHLNDRDDLWRLLVIVTVRKAQRELERQHAQKRGGGKVRGESAFLGRGDASSGGGIGQVLGSEPTPEFAVMMAEQCARLLDRLPEDSLRAVALLKLEGYSIIEIARKADCSLRTANRRLARIRELWADDIRA
jgi:DNA-directed RNA polymerase specialized sigma24 family protein